MGAMADTKDLIVATALETGGAVRRDRLLELGVSGSAIDRLARSDWLGPYCRGVFVVRLLAGPSTTTWAPVLATPGSGLARASVGVRHGFEIQPPDRLHLLARKGAGRQLPGVMVHETRRLRAFDITTTRDGFPITTPERTLVDLGAEVTERRLAHLVSTQAALVGRRATASSPRFWHCPGQVCPGCTSCTGSPTSCSPPSHSTDPLRAAGR